MHTGATAVLGVARRLSRPLRGAARVAGWVPSPVREWAYRAVAQRRYRWFGKREACRISSPETRQRFLDVG